MSKVAYFTTFSKEVIDLVAGMAPDGIDVTGKSSAIDEAEKIEMVREADFLMLHGGRLSEPVLRAGRGIRLLQLLSAGYDNIDLELLRELGIPLANVGGANRQGVAEMAITLILAVLRKLAQMDPGLRAGLWKDAMSNGLDTFELAGKTVGIVGFGLIGQTVARLLLGFANRIYVADVVEHAEAEKELNANRVSLDELLRISDIVTLHTPLLPQTRGLIGKRELGLMKPTAVLVNTSRGGVVDEEALTKALESGTISGAGLDVFEKEPVDPRNPLLKMKNVVLSPHAAGGTYESWPRRARFAYENFERVLRGEQPLSLVTT